MREEGTGFALVPMFSEVWTPCLGLPLSRAADTDPHSPESPVHYDPLWRGMGAHRGPGLGPRTGSRFPRTNSSPSCIQQSPGGPSPQHAHQCSPAISILVPGVGRITVPPLSAASPEGLCESLWGWLTASDNGLSEMN